MILGIIVLIHLSLFLEYVQSALLVERPNGFFITGRGCGTTTALKYLNYLPKKLEEHQCSFINLNAMIPVKGDQITPPDCKNPWKNFRRDFCIRFYSKSSYRTTFDSAQAECKEQDGTLFEPRSVEDSEFFTNMTANLFENEWNIWIGYTDKDRPKNDFVALSSTSTENNDEAAAAAATESTTGSTALSYKNFEPGYPTSTSDNNCLSLDISHGKWKDRQCDDEFRYACMKPRVQYYN